MLLAVFLPEAVLYRAWDQWWAARTLTCEVNKVVQRKTEDMTDKNPNLWGQSDFHPCLAADSPGVRSDKVDHPGDFDYRHVPRRRHTDPGCDGYSNLNQRDSHVQFKNCPHKDSPSLHDVNYDGHPIDGVKVPIDQDSTLRHRSSSSVGPPVRISSNPDQSRIRLTPTGKVTGSVDDASASAAGWGQESVTSHETEIEQLKESTPWTTTQSLFVISGGVAVDSTSFWHKPRLTLTPEGILRLAQVGLLPKISKEDVEDRSKADAFAKIVACTQAIWFIIQCFARVATGLPLTLLEVHTMTHIACALAMYGIWFKKAYGVESPILCEDERVVNFAAMLAVDTEIKLYNGVRRIPQCSAQNYIGIDAVWKATLVITEHMKWTRITLEHLRRANEAIHDLRERGIHYKWDKSQYGAVDFGACAAVVDPCSNLSEMMVVGRLDAKYENLWAPIHVHIAVALFSGLYGGSHLGAWALQFPTAGEMWAWRACGIAMVALPVFGVLGWASRRLELRITNRCATDVDSGRRDFFWVCLYSVFLVGVTNLFYYLRLYILAESLASLRSPVPGTYKSVDWIAFVPHFL